jgi:hypothetical protein
MFAILWKNVMFFNATREKQSNLLEHYNCFQFHLLFGGISLWILFWDYLNWEKNQSTWWSLIIFPGMLIYVLFSTHLPLPLWLKFSWIKSSRFLVCLILLFFIETPLSPATFGKNCSGYREPNCISAQLIIPRLMVKLNLSTSVWKHILGFFHQK